MRKIIYSIDTLDKNPRGMTRKDIKKEIRYWNVAQFAGPATQKLAMQRVSMLEKELERRGKK